MIWLTDGTSTSTSDRKTYHIILILFLLISISGDMDSITTYADVKKLSLLELKNVVKARGLKIGSNGRRALECLLCKELGISLQVPLRIPKSCSDNGPRPPRNAIGEHLRKNPRFVNIFFTFNIIDLAGVHLPYRAVKTIYYFFPSYYFQTRRPLPLPQGTWWIPRIYFSSDH